MRRGNNFDWKYFKGVSWFALIYFVVPLFIYFFITDWDPTKYLIYVDEGPLPIGMVLFIGLYLVSAYLITRWRNEAKTRKGQLKRLLDGVMNSVEYKHLQDELSREPHFSDDDEALRWGYPPEKH